MTPILFLGDISLNNGYNELYKTGINPFEKLKKVLDGHQYVVGNLECLAEGDGGENLKKRPRLKTYKQTLNYLNNIGLNLACLANNHVYDNLRNGFETTLQFLDANNISYLGAGVSKEKANKPHIEIIDGYKFCFFNYVTKDTNPSLPENSDIFLNFYSESKCISNLKEHMSCDFRIVMLHWGGKFEGGNYPDFHQKEIAKEITKAGADLIIGHHSHTFQPYRKYNNKYVFYSLGNFCFSDIKSDGRMYNMSSRAYRESALVRVSYDQSIITPEIFPIVRQKLILHFKKNIKYKYLIRNRVFSLMEKIPFLWNTYSINHNFIKPVFKQLFRKDKERNLWVRFKELDKDKLRQLFRN